jgi:hypothetical protein
LIFLWWDWGLKSGHHTCKTVTCKAGTLLLIYTSGAFCACYFGNGGLSNYLPKLASNRDPPDLKPPKLLGLQTWVTSAWLGFWFSLNLDWKIVWWCNLMWEKQLQQTFEYLKVTYWYNFFICSWDFGISIM